MYTHKVIANKIHRKFRPERFVQDEEIKRWYADGGDDRFRYDYPLNKDSIAIDAGAYHGEWSERIYNKYNCNIYAFEPVKEYFDITKKRLRGAKKVKVIEKGLSGKTRAENIYLDGVSTSTYLPNAKPEKIQLVDIIEFCKRENIKTIDLIKINIEGGEYELLDRIISSGLVEQIKHIQVQFHSFVPDAEKKMIALQRRLSKTHRPTYQYWWIWDNWQRKDLK